MCEVTEANINDVSKAVGMDSRIGKNFLNSGPGFGGSCFKKDISNLIYICSYYKLNEVADYWEKVLSINNWQQNRISKIIVEKLFGTISDKRITILGFSFKSNTNDTRESSSIKICKNLLEEGCYLSIYDPKVSKKQIDKDLSEIINSGSKDMAIEKRWSVYSSYLDAASGSDALVLLTEWEEFSNGIK